MAELWQYAVCDENGDMHEMPELMARACASACAPFDEQEWSLWQRRVQVGDWSRAKPTGGEPL